jgi:hypothetical protein
VQVVLGLIGPFTLTRARYLGLFGLPIGARD